MDETPKLIRLQDIIESRAHKEKELEYYRKKIEEIEGKMYWLNRDLEVTNIIIHMIENESVPVLSPPKD